MKNCHAIVVLLFVFLLSAISGPAMGQGKGEGAIVVLEEAPVYKKATGAEVTWKLRRGDAVVGSSRKLAAWQFYEVSGRVQIVFLDEVAARPRGGWMRPDDLAKFTYDFCSYDPNFPISPGYPFTPGRRQTWNICFQEARDAKLKELRAAWEEEGAGKSTKVPSDASSQEKPKPEAP